MRSWTAATTSERSDAGVDEVGHPELRGERTLGGDRVDTDDPRCSGQPSALHHVDADPTKAEDDHAVAGSDVLQRRADAGRHGAAEQTHGLQRRILPDPRQGDLGDDRVTGERRGAHEVVDLLVAEVEATRPVRHDTDGRAFA